jgi:hypothetical protein
MGKPVNPELLTICDDPLPAHRASLGNKYAPILRQLKPGQAIKCATADVGRVCGALRKWIDEHGPKGASVRSCRDYGDGLGRVWLMAAVVDANAKPVVKPRTVK